MAKFTKQSLAIALRLALLEKQNDIGMRPMPLGNVELQDPYAYIPISSVTTGKEIGVISVKQDYTDHEGEFTICCQSPPRPYYSCPQYKATGKGRDACRKGMRSGNFDSDSEFAAAVDGIAAWLNHESDTGQAFQATDEKHNLVYFTKQAMIDYIALRVNLVTSGVMQRWDVMDGSVAALSADCEGGMMMCFEKEGRKKAVVAVFRTDFTAPSQFDEFVYVGLGTGAYRATIHLPLKKGGVNGGVSVTPDDMSAVIQAILDKMDSVWGAGAVKKAA